MRHLQRALVTLAVLLPLVAAAAAEESTEPVVLPPVVVEAPRAVPVIAIPDRLLTEQEARREIERTPGGVGLVGQEAIEDSRATNLGDVLEFVPGVLVRPRRGGTSDESQISIRGSGLRNNFHVRGLNVLVDGFVVNNADGFFRPEVLELLATKRIEVYKGANSLRFGANSLGGAINVVTKTGADAPLVEARSEGGSYGFFKNYLATGQLHGPFDAYMGLSQSELDGFQDHSNHSRQRAYATAGYRFEDGPSLRLDFNFVNNREQLPGALTQAEFDQDPRQAQPAAITQNARHDYQFTRAAFTVHTPLTKTQALEWFGQYHYTDLDHPLPFAVIDNVDNNWATELRYILAAPLFGHGNRLIMGLQYAETRQADVQFANLQGTHGAKTKDQINRARNIGLYAENQFDLTPAVTLVAGGRLQYAFRSVDDRFLTEADARPDDSDSIDYVSFSPQVGAIWQVAPAVQVYGNASRAFEPPSSSS